MPEKDFLNLFRRRQALVGLPGLHEAKCIMKERIRKKASLLQCSRMMVPDGKPGLTGGQGLGRLADHYRQRLVRKTGPTGREVLG